jgi:5-methylcytosine-specific restriction endonuclease McrA
MKDWAGVLYNTKRWQRLRKYIWQRDKGLCQECLKKGIIKQGEAVHHIVELTPENVLDPDVALNPDNLETLCRECHGAKHGKQKRYKIDELGRVIITELTAP